MGKARTKWDRCLYCDASIAGDDALVAMLHDPYCPHGKALLKLQQCESRLADVCQDRERILADWSETRGKLETLQQRLDRELAKGDETFAELHALRGQLEAAEQHVKILREQSDGYALRLGVVERERDHVSEGFAEWRKQTAEHLRKVKQQCRCGAYDRALSDETPVVETRCRNLVKIEGAQWSEECTLPRGHDGDCCPLPRVVERTVTPYDSHCPGTTDGRHQWKRWLNGNTGEAVMECKVCRTGYPSPV